MAAVSLDIRTLPLAPTAPSPVPTSRCPLVLLLAPAAVTIVARQGRGACQLHAPGVCARGLSCRNADGARQVPCRVARGQVQVPEGSGACRSCAHVDRRPESPPRTIMSPALPPSIVSPLSTTMLPPSPTFVCPPSVLMLADCDADVAA